MKRNGYRGDSEYRKDILLKDFEALALHLSGNHEFPNMCRNCDQSPDHFIG